MICIIGQYRVTNVGVAACIHAKYIFLKSAGRAKSVILRDMYVLRSTVARVGGVMDHGIYVSTP